MFRSAGRERCKAIATNTACRRWGLRAHSMLRAHSHALSGEFVKDLGRNVRPLPRMEKLVQVELLLL